MYEPAPKKKKRRIVDKDIFLTRLSGMRETQPPKKTIFLWR
jgi:hypothetical protein